jgi:ABC-type Zn uptake system ZnuABC Zn-binding protein ZnuA
MEYLKIKKGLVIFSMFLVLLVSCQPILTTSAPQTFKVLAIETFLADIAQNVAGDLFQVSYLIPPGLDPHSFELVPQDVVRLASSDLIITNGAGLESWLAVTLASNTINIPTLEASKGLANRIPKPGEIPPSDVLSPTGQILDPHFWLDPIDVITYVQNIRDAFSTMDPVNAPSYTLNAAGYIAQLKSVDQWIQDQVNLIPAQDRLLVTNHETFGYFADRYGFTIVGAVIPSTSTDASPSAQQMADLITIVKADRVKAVFLETGSNPDLAQQVAAETGIKIVESLYTHSTSAVGGPATTYLEMMRYDATQIVDALK